MAKSPDGVASDRSPPAGRGSATESDDEQRGNRGVPKRGGRSEGRHPADYRDFFKRTFGPVVGTYASLAEEPERVAALDRDFLQFATSANSGPAGGPAEYRYEYLLVVTRKSAT